MFLQRLDCRILNTSDVSSADVERIRVMLFLSRFVSSTVNKISRFITIVVHAGACVNLFIMFSTFALLLTPSFAESNAMGDSAAGEKTFAKRCASCHVVVNESGETLAGKKAKIGPNLYGVTTRKLGSISGFRYGKSILKAGEIGTVWNRENFVGFVQNPTGWLRAILKNPKVRSKMSFKVRKEEDAQNIYAFLYAMDPKVVTTTKKKVEVVKVETLVSYSSDQASRGKKKYEKKCAECHGKEFKGGMNGGPPLRGLRFLEKWGNGEPASELYYFLSEQMPPDSPGRFSSKVYADMMAYILKKNGFKRGAPLPWNLDALDQLIMKKR